MCSVAPEISCLASERKSNFINYFVLRLVWLNMYGPRLSAAADVNLNPAPPHAGVCVWSEGKTENVIY